jgi:hypothetical protein
MYKLFLPIQGLVWQSWLPVDWEKFFCSAILGNLINGLMDLEEVV